MIQLVGLSDLEENQLNLRLKSILESNLVFLKIFNKKHMRMIHL